MAYSTPRTWVAGEVATAANLNTYLRDNVAWIATDSPSCRVYNSANISVANGAEPTLTYNSERWDNAAMHSTSSNTNRITIPSGGAGKYVIGSGVGWASNAAGYRQQSIWTDTVAIGYQSVSAVSGSNTEMHLSTVFACSAADNLYVYVLQTSGGSLNVAANSSYSPEFFVFWFRN